MRESERERESETERVREREREIVRVRERTEREERERDIHRSLSIEMQIRIFSTDVRGKDRHRDNVIATADFTTLVDHQATSKWSCSYRALFLGQWSATFFIYYF